MTLRLYSGFSGLHFCACSLLPLASYSCRNHGYGFNRRSAERQHQCEPRVVEKNDHVRRDVSRGVVGACGCVGPPPGAEMAVYHGSRG